LSFDGKIFSFLELHVGDAEFLVDDMSAKEAFVEVETILDKER
jgi:hypothetical protein